MDRRQFLRVAGGGVIAPAVALPLAACSSDYPAEAVQAWHPAADGGDVRRWILGYAILAPHSHNLQSWLVDLRRPGEILLYCDLERLLPETDPYSRQMMVSQGTFLELLDLAARERGQRTEIRLFPEGEFDRGKPDRRPTAHIRIAADSGVKKDPLFAQILKRRTNREAYEAKPVPPAAVREIAASVATYPVRTGFVGADSPDLLRRHRAIA